MHSVCWSAGQEKFLKTPFGEGINELTLGLGVGPGELRPVLVMLQPPFLFAEGGVLQRASAPAPGPAPALHFAAVWNSAVGRLAPDLCDARDAALSSGPSSA